MIVSKIFKITNMHCTACAMTLEGIEDDLNGVKRASANYANQHLLIEYDAALVSDGQIVTAIRQLGYDVGEKS